MFCLSKKQDNVKETYLQGTQSSEFYGSIFLRLRTCQNTSDSPVVCATPEKISSMMRGALITTAYNQLSINPQEPEEPGSMFRANTFTPVDTATVRTTSFNMVNVKVTSDVGWLVEDRHTLEYMKMDNVIQSMSLGSSPRGILWTGIFQLSQLQTNYKRSYPRVQELLAGIQGLISATILAILLLTKTYSRMKMKESLINEIFDVKVKKKRTDGAKPELKIDPSSPFQSSPDEPLNINSIQLSPKSNTGLTLLEEIQAKTKDNNELQQYLTSNDLQIREESRKEGVFDFNPDYIAQEALYEGQSATKELHLK